MNKRKHFAKKFKNEDFKLTCIDELLHKLAKNNKSIQIMKTMKILHGKNNMTITTLHAKSTTS